MLFYKRFIVVDFFFKAGFSSHFRLGMDLNLTASPEASQCCRNSSFSPASVLTCRDSNSSEMNVLTNEKPLKVGHLGITLLWLKNGFTCRFIIMLFNKHSTPMPLSDPQRTVFKIKCKNWCGRTGDVLWILGAYNTHNAVGHSGVLCKKAVKRLHISSKLTSLTPLKRSL